MAAKPHYAVGLDLGGGKTRLVICLVEDRSIRFLGAAEVDAYGWVKGRINDQQVQPAGVRDEQVGRRDRLAVRIAPNEVRRLHMILSRRSQLSVVQHCAVGALCSNSVPTLTDLTV